MLTFIRRHSPTLSLLMILPLWQLVCVLADVPSYIFPSPSAIFEAFFNVELSRWFGHLWATLYIAILGFIIAIGLSIPIAIIMVRSDYLNRTLYPILVVVQSTPVVAIAPLLIVILGTGDAPRLAITFLISFFPLVVATTTGLQATPKELIELSKSLRAKPSREIWQIRLPFAVPYIFSGLKVAITLAIIGAVIAEFVAAEKGLGYFIQFSTSYFKIPQAFASLMLLSVISLLLFNSIKLIQKTFFAWSIGK
ncbi:ABC transporter permease [Alginatibacterium sediminis]|uniref:ABC transporter permease n=1 Tax=Alginatibacterium sediminis TaxID=2164068 RepID=A0A420E6X3_9ALTE|nr:ABC transporter permease [Alginatibacterium sediminis]RKF13733.1 ABC transporter permease [Alginatibacterium sediminis]